MKAQPQAAAAPRRAAYATPWLFLALGLFVLGVQMAWIRLDAHRDAEAEARHWLENHSQILHDSLERDLRSVDAALRYLSEHGPEHMADTGHSVSELTTLTDVLPNVRTVLLLDARGILLTSNRTELIGRNFAERDYFTALQHAPSPNRLHVTPPFITVYGIHTIALSRPIYNAQGEFAGVAVAVLAPGKLRAKLNGMHSPVGTRLSILHGDGLLLTLVPEREDLAPEAAVTNPGSLFHRHRASGQPASYLIGQSALTGTATAISMRTLQPAGLDMTTPLLVATARDQADILARWQVETYDYVAAYLLITTVGALALAFHQRRRRELEGKLDETHQQLLQSEKMASLGQIAAGVAHEINNPIGFVSSNLRTLQNYLHDLFRVAAVCEEAAARARIPEDFARIQTIKNEVDFDYLRTDIFHLLEESVDGLVRVKKIVQDLKDFSRPGEAEWQFADLHQGLDSTLNIVAHEIKYKCEVHKEYGDLPLVRCLPAQLNQVFLNLLTNAAQSIPEKGEIHIRTGCAGDEVFITVSDNGSGIAPEHLDRIFDPFFTTKPVGQGTGLGLSLSYGIVQKHGGRIEVVSRVDAGTTFTIWLPVAGKPSTDNTHEA